MFFFLYTTLSVLYILGAAITGLTSYALGHLSSAFSSRFGWGGQSNRSLKIESVVYGIGWPVIGLWLIGSVIYSVVKGR